MYFFKFLNNFVKTTNLHKIWRNLKIMHIMQKTWNYAGNLKKLDYARDYANAFSWCP